MSKFHTPELIGAALGVMVGMALIASAICSPQRTNLIAAFSGKVRPIDGGGYLGSLTLSNNGSDSLTVLGIGRVDCDRCSVCPELPVTLCAGCSASVDIRLTSLPENKLPLEIYCDDKDASTTFLAKIQVIQDPRHVPTLAPALNSK